MQAIVTFEKVQDVSEEDIAQFIYDALTTWGGQKHPDDPLFHSLTVKAVRIGNQNYIAPEMKGVS